MAVYRNGSRGSGVRDLQTALNKAGYKPPLETDGVFGPLTKAAVEWYQRENNLEVDGIAGPMTLASIGQIESPGSGKEADPGNTDQTLNKPLTGVKDYTDPEETRFNGLPGKPEIWHEKETGKVYAVYYVPNSEPPIPLLYHVPNEDDLKGMFGGKDPVYDRNISTKDIDSFGSIRWGTTDDIPATDGDPWTGFVNRFERASETQPWLKDPEVFAVFSAAWLEGREPESWELESTDWWQDHTEAEREWMWLTARNPAEADRVLDDNYIKTYNAFVALGMDDVNDELVQYMANQFTFGRWSSSYLGDQIEAIFDPSRTDEVDSALADFMKTEGVELGSPALGVSDVRDQWSRWLGPAYPPTDEQVTEWAARLRAGGEGAQDQLTEHLRQQRMAMYPEYENSDLTYDDIASPWRGFATNAWGMTMDETDPVFQQLIKMNDTVEGGKLLRREGLKQGISQVHDTAMRGLFGTQGDIRRAV